MKRYTTKEVADMIKQVEKYGITVKGIDETNQAIFVSANGINGVILFNDFVVDLDIFLDMAMLGAECKHKINFKMEDLKKGILNPVCTCGGNIKREYDGEVTENYYFTCECGAHEVVNGYWLDTLLD